MRKNYFFPLLFLLFSLLGFSQTNLLKNPSFEDSFVVASENFNDWNINFNTVRTKVTDATDGTYAVKIQTNRSDSSGFFAELSAATPSNDLAFENGKTYTISFDYKVETGTITELKASLQRDNFYLEDEEILTNLAASSWQNLSYDFTAGFTAAHNFDINIIGSTANAEIIIDNTSVIEKVTNPDRDALIAFYNATDGPNWTYTWDLNKDMNTWPGITLYPNGRVRYIQLDSRNLVGEIPDEIGNLSELEIIRLGRNELIGEIPTQLGSLLKLRTLDLSNNELTGNIPSALGNLSNLENLYLYSNQLDGIIPTELAGLSSIKQIHLTLNQLSGPIPVFLSNLSTLTHLELYGNQLTGTIPSELGNLNALESLVLGNNDLTGTIPSQIYNLTSLYHLNLFATNITGSIPPEIGNLTQLLWLRLGDTSMSGSIPPEIGNLTELEDLALFRSNFSGPLPQEIGNLTNLKTLRIESNNFSGSIPSSIGNLTQLKELQLRYNNFSGNLPSEIGNLVLLENFYLTGNDLSGSLPPTIGNLNSIKTLWLSQNDFSGTIPPEIGNLVQLEYLVLSSNSLTGTIPKELGNMTNLTYLELGNNNITGAIPDEIGDLPQLTAFGCYECSLSGKIPVFGSNLSKNIELRNNNLVFDDLESSVVNSTSTSFNLDPQSNLNNEEVIELELGDEINLSVTGLSSNSNQYQWRKDGTNLIGETNPSLAVSSASVTDIGIYDCVITNPNVPSLKLYRKSITLEINGVDGESDDDNDGVKASNDYCPNTSPGATVNADGCSESQLDDDNDGVNNTQDICPDTGFGDTVNPHGCSPSQLENNDGDEDGVPDDLDNCPNTPSGAIVGNGGCSYLDVLVPKSDDITVKVTNTTCTNTNNGEITVNFKVSQTYYITITGPNGFSENHTKQSGSSLVINNLMAGAYNLVINSQIGVFLAAPNTEFHVLVETPEAFIAGKTVVDNTKKTAKLVVSGSKEYAVVVNNREFKYSFDDTGIHELAFDLNDGTNTIRAKTDKNCQGEYQETYVLNRVMVSPNPTSSVEATILGLTNSNNATLSMTDSGGALIKSFNLDIQNGTVVLPISDLPSGLYYINIKSIEQDVQTKLIKR